MGASQSVESEIFVPEPEDPEPEVESEVDEYSDFEQDNSIVWLFPFI